MEAAPNDEPEVSLEDYSELRERLADAIDSLTEEEQFFFNAVVVERLSYRQVETAYGHSKTRTHVFVRDVKEKLRVMLEDDPIVALFLHTPLVTEDEDE
jgi:DNA-directed RNA polymerase specialized sigma24 family protein